MGDLKEAFGGRVRELRERLGLSQHELAEKADLHWTYVSGIERGVRNPGLTILGKLAEGLGTSLADLVADLDSQSVRATKRGRPAQKPPRR